MENVWVQLGSQVGATGLLAWVMYSFARRFMDGMEKQMVARIDSLEKRLEACEADRTKLHQEFAELLLKQIPRP